MIGEEINEALADHAGGAEDASANLFSIAPDRDSSEI
jgi:hypothetical protein